VTGEVTKCYTDTDGFPLAYSFFVVKDSSINSTERLTKPSPDSTLELEYGPKAFATSGSATNVFKAEVE
jgi:hypothetical protein